MSMCQLRRYLMIEFWDLWKLFPPSIFAPSQNVGIKWVLEKLPKILWTSHLKVLLVLFQNYQLCLLKYYNLFQHFFPFLSWLLSLSFFTAPKHRRLYSIFPLLLDCGCIKLEQQIFLFVLLLLEAPSPLHLFFFFSFWACRLLVLSSLFFFFFFFPWTPLLLHSLSLLFLPFLFFFLLSYARGFALDLLSFYLSFCFFFLYVWAFSWTSFPSFFFIPFLVLLRRFVTPLSISFSFSLCSTAQLGGYPFLLSIFIKLIFPLTVDYQKKNSCITVICTVTETPIVRSVCSTVELVGFRGEAHRSNNGHCSTVYIFGI